MAGASRGREADPGARALGGARVLVPCARARERRDEVAGGPAIDCGKVGTGGGCGPSTGGRGRGGGGGRGHCGGCRRLAISRLWCCGGSGGLWGGLGGLGRNWGLTEGGSGTEGRAA